MSRKTRKKRRHNDPQPERARRHLAKGDAKAALKEAKCCFRADPGDENRRLLEEAYLGRVEQLHRMRQISEAKTLLAELVKLAPTTQQVAQQIPRLKVILGVGGVDTNSLLESDPALLVQVVDQAMLDPRVDVPDYANLRSQVVAVRAALAAVEGGEDEVAAEQLMIISRNSPLADWRLLVRGLSAFYQHDDERTRKNWEKLDAARPASRIAHTLLTVAGMAESSETANVSDGLRKLERHSSADAAVGSIRKLAGAWKRKDWPVFFQLYRQLKQRLGKSHEALIRQIVDLVWKRAVREGDYDLVDQLVKIGPAPIMDPRWNRAEALLAEDPESGMHLDAAESSWMAYAHDVAALPCLREEERPIAVGLIHQRLARQFARQANRLDALNSLFFHQERYEELLFHAAKHYRRSIEVCPLLKASYLELVELHEENDEAGKAALVMRKLAKQDPDCFEAAIWLACYYLGEDEPGKSEPYVNMARRLRPRDPRCTVLPWNQKVTMVRCLTIKRQFEAARQELSEAVPFAPNELEPYSFDLLQAGIEFKAKNLDAANALVEAALAKVDEATPVWMQMSSVAARMRVAREFKKEFDERFKADIKNPPTSVSAGRMARFLSRMKLSKVNYTGRATQEKLLIQHLQGAVEIEWDENDLRHVCQFLALLPRQHRLHKKFTDRGVERFPQVPQFSFWAGLQEMESGPFFCDKREVMALFEKAIALHEQGEYKLSESELEHLRTSLSLVKDFHEREQDFAADMPFYLDDEDDEYEEGDEDFEMLQAGPGLMDDQVEEGIRLDEAALAMLERTMPAGVRDTLDQFAAAAGIDREEVLHRILSGEKLDEFAESVSAPHKPNAKQKQSRKRKAARH